MSYEDFWFIDTRDQTRNLRRYFLWFILLFAFVTVGSILAVKTMYNEIKVLGIQSSDIEITVSEAKATNVNGYIKGEINNKSENEINGKYLCFVLLNSKNEIVGTEFLSIGELSTSQLKTYELKFKANNVDGFYIAITDKEL